VIRDQIGFDGLLLTDDLDMGALACLGDIPQRALAALEAGCDIALYCHGDYDMMAKLADVLPCMGDAALERYERSRIRRRPAA
jgi:beta-N-acetylhexosaminidase